MKYKLEEAKEIYYDKITNKNSSNSNLTRDFSKKDINKSVNQDNNSQNTSKMLNRGRSTSNISKSLMRNTSRSEILNTSKHSEKEIRKSINKKLVDRTYKSNSKIIPKTGSNKLEKETISIQNEQFENEPTEINKIMNIRKHLNDFYANKKLNEKAVAFKNYMTTHDNKKDINNTSNNYNKENDKKSKNNIYSSYTDKTDFIVNDNYVNSMNYSLDNQTNDREIYNKQEELNNLYQKYLPNYEIENENKKIYKSNNKIDNRSNYDTFRSEKNNTESNSLNDQRQLFTFKSGSEDNLEQFKPVKLNNNSYNFKKDFAGEVNASSINKTKVSNLPHGRYNNKSNFNNKDSLEMSNENQHKNLKSYDLPLNITKQTIDDKNHMLNNRDKIIDNETPNFQKRLEDLSYLQTYANSINKEASKILENNMNKYNIPEMKTDLNKGILDYNRYEARYRDKIVNEENQQYKDSQAQLDKMRDDVNKNLLSKQQSYEKDYNKANDNIDYVNERLKLNNLSKNYLVNKINEFTTIKSNNQDNNSSKNIFHFLASNLDEFRRKKK